MRYPIPTEALDDRLGFVGTSGSGKTYNAMAGVELVLNSRGRVVIPDPLGVWWGLALAADGKQPMLWRKANKLVIFGGPHGDLPLTEHAGALIGETVAGMAESAIIDLSGLGTKARERRFMLAFLGALYGHATGEPVHLVFDEADMWAPQRLLDKEGDAAKLQAQMETIVRRGRIKGFIPWLITQRPAVLSKDVLSQVDGLVAFKLTASQDRAALGDWIEGQADRAQGREILARLPEMQRGQGVIWVPGRGIMTTATFPEKVTYDSSRTPKRGEKQQRAASLAPLDVVALKERLATVEAETKANDPKALRAEVARLNRELQKAQQNIPKNIPAADPNAIAEAERRGLVAGHLSGFAEALKLYDKFLVDTWTALEKRTEALTALRSLAASRLSELSGAKDAVPIAKPPASVTVRIPRAKQETNGSKPPSDLSGPHQRIVDAIAWWAAIGHPRPTRTQLAFVAGYKPNTGTFNTYLGALSTAGLIEYPERGHVSLTEAGTAAAQPPDRLGDQQDLHDRVTDMLSGPQAKLLAQLIVAYPDPMSRDQLAEATGYQPNTGTFNTYLGSLSSLEIVEYPERGRVRAAEWLFP